MHTQFHHYERRTHLQKLVPCFLCKAQYQRESLPISPDIMPLNYPCNNFPLLFSNILFLNGAGISVDATSQCPGERVCVLNEPCQEAVIYHSLHERSPRMLAVCMVTQNKWPTNQKKEPTTTWEKSKEETCGSF